MAKKIEVENRLVGDVNKWIDFSTIPIYEKGPYKGKFDWKNAVGLKIGFKCGDTEGYIEVIEYIKGSRIKIKWADKTKIISTSSLLKRSLDELTGKYSFEYRYSIGKELKDSHRNLVIIGRETRSTTYQNYRYYRVQCNTCGWDEGYVEELELKHGAGCSCCVGRTVVVGINDIPTTAPWMIPYFQDGYEEAKLYTAKSGKAVRFVCPDCNRTKEKKIRIITLHKRGGIGCTCGDGKSYPHKFMFSVLTQININFQEEYQPQWLEGKKFDFYLPKRRLIIEMDGGIGHGKSEVSRHFPIHKSTAIQYLKKGVEFGWCQYDPKKAMSKGAILSNIKKKAGA